VSHANAALTPRHRLKLARAVAEDGWSVSYAAAVFNVSWPTAKRWADRGGHPGHRTHHRPTGHSPRLRAHPATPGSPPYTPPDLHTRRSRGGRDL